MVNIPGENGYVQNNQGDGLGTVHESFNLDFESNQGKIRTTRTKLIKTGTGAVDAFGYTSAIVYFNTAIRVFSGIITGDNLWNGGNSPFDSLTGDTTSTNAAIDDGDAIVFNNQIYVTSGSAIDKYDGTTTETSVSSGLTDNTPHLLAVFSPDGSGERLYVTQGNDKVWSVSQGDVVATSSTYTLDLSLEPNYQTTVLMAGTDRLWVGVSSAGNNSGNGISYMFEWDGVTANSPSRKYKINASRLMAGVIKDDIPYVMDSRGRLLAFNGSNFQEVARLPINDGTLLNESTNIHQNGIHPRGMAVDLDEILICVSNLKEGSTGSSTMYHDFPAGVWAYSETNGLYHKYSPSFQAVADTGTTNLTDYGQFRAAYAGPIKVFEVQTTTTSDGGHIMFAMGYFTGSGDNITTGQDIQFGLWTDDTNDNTQKAGWYVSPRIPAGKFMDFWRKIYPKISELETSGDLVEVKYRMKDETPTYFSGTWGGNDRFSTSTELTDYAQGDEVTVIHGKGGGNIAHVSSITTGAGSEVILDRTITGVVSNDTAKFRMEKWKKVASTTDNFTEGFTVGEPNKGNWIQVKVYAQWTGERELYGILIDNASSIS